LVQAAVIWILNRLILTALGEKEPAQLMVSRRRSTRPGRDLVLYILAHLNTVTKKAGGKLVGIGYTAVTQASKGCASSAVHGRKLREQVNRLLIGF
jgi:hypothetical protein